MCLAMMLKRKDIWLKMLGAYNAKLSVTGESVTTVEYVFGDDAKA